jgi:hypothetical protein
MSLEARFEVQGDIYPPGIDDPDPIEDYRIEALELILCQSLRILNCAVA